MPEFVWLSSGDKLPAVAIAQLLLKRTGHKIAIDGQYGSQTTLAVREFQRTHRPLSVDGVIGQNTWPRLATHEHLPVLDCIDIFDPDLLSSEARYLRATGANPVLIGGMSNGIEQAVTEIRSRARNLFLLRFHGHGASGVAGVSDGTGDLGEHQSSFQSSPVVRRVLGQLRGVFGPYGCIQFMHCSTGAGQQGARFLQMIADATGVPATAAYRLQYAGTLRETLRYEGPTRTACPSGRSLRAWARGLPEFAGMSVA
jgi:putative peptidoglycan binding protein